MTEPVRRILSVLSDGKEHTVREITVRANTRPTYTYAVLRHLVMKGHLAQRGRGLLLYWITDTGRQALRGQA